MSEPASYQEEAKCRENEGEAHKGGELGSPHAGDA
jgi:hypothetical protein